MAKPTAVFVVGTRPDAIKSAPTILEFQKHPEIDTIVLSTGQHGEMLAQALQAFGLEAHHDLQIMTAGQTLAQVTTRALEGIDAVLEQKRPTMVFAQGDTTTTFVAGLAAFYRQIPFGHIEAGLRTESIWNPFPEEFNRRTLGFFAAQNYAPTQGSANNLLREGVAEDRVFVTGNTGIDAVLAIAEQDREPWYPHEKRRIVLLTTHRRENWGDPQVQIAKACRRLLEKHYDIKLVVPMHKNPLVRESLMPVLSGMESVDLIEPPDYANFVHLMRRAHLILTDSGGIQEEAPSFGIPVLVLRTTTERPEGVDAGVARLIGTDEQAVFTEADAVLSDPMSYGAMAQAKSPYGDGKASSRIWTAAQKVLFS